MAKIFEVIEKYDYNPFENIDRAEAEKQMKTLAKRANARLLRLERSTSLITGESYASYGAYTVYAKPALRGARRFKEGNYKEWTYKELGKRILEIEEFLRSKTSTVSGQREAEEKRIATFASGKWGSSRDEDVPGRSISAAGRKDFYDFLNSRVYADFRKLGYTSEKLIEFYDEVTELEHEKGIEIFEEAYNKYMQEKDAGMSEFMDFLGISPFDM